MTNDKKFEQLAKKIEILEIARDDYTEQLEKENMELVQQVVTMKKEVDKEQQRQRAENAKIMNDIKGIKERLEDIDGVNGALYILKDIASKHKKDTKQKRATNKDEYTDNEKEEIDKAWDMLKEESKEEDVD